MVDPRGLLMSTQSEFRNAELHQEHRNAMEESGYANQSVADAVKTREQACSNQGGAKNLPFFSFDGIRVLPGGVMGLPALGYEVGFVNSANQWEYF